MPSFDVVNKLAMHEVENAVHQTQKEVAQRFDFKDTGTELEKNAEGIVLRSNSEGRLEAALKVLQEKLVKRNVSLKVLDVQDAQPAGGTTWRQLLKLQEGIVIEKAKDIVKHLKDSKLKVQGSIQGDVVRVTGKKRDDLQAAIAVLKEKDFGVPLQYINFRE